MIFNNNYKQCRKGYLLVLMAVALQACGQNDSLSSSAEQVSNDAPWLATFTARNPSNFAREQQAFHLGLNQLGIDITSVTKGVVVMSGDQELPSQLIDTDANRVADTLFFVADLKAGEEKTFNFMASPSVLVPPKKSQAEISHKVGGEWQGKVYVGGEFKNVDQLTPPPQYTDHSEYIRYEGPGIESDKVGYRVYLDWRNGFDIFGKLTSEPVLQNVGVDGYSSYHDPADWGMDILKVGKSLGAGGFGYWKDEQVFGVADVASRAVQITEAEGIYSSLRINYNGWKIAGHTTDITADIAMNVGSRWATNTLTTSPALDALVVGLGKHSEAELIVGSTDVTGEEWTYIATWGEQSLNNDLLGKAILFQKRDLQEITQDDHSHVVRLKTRNGQVVYKFAAVWQPEAGKLVETKAEFQAYLQREADKLTFAPRTRLVNAIEKQQKQSARGPEYALYWAERLAESEVARRGDSLAYGGFDKINGKPAVWAYTTGFLSQAVDKVAAASGNKALHDFSQANLDSYIEADGRIKTYQKDTFNVDKINSGKMLIEYYKRTGDEKYKLAAAVLRDQLVDHPKTSGGAFWHKKRYPGQLWLDGVYMVMPFLAAYTEQFEDGSSFDQVLHEFEQVDELLKDPKTGLYYHAWDEYRQQVWANPEHGRSSYFWSRGMGWLAMAMVDTLDFLPEDHTEERAQLLAQLQAFTDAILAQRSDQGIWQQILAAEPAPANYNETSGSAMFLYMVAKGINQGYLDERYKPVAIDIYNAIVDQFIQVHADNSVSLSGICQVAGLGYGRDGSYRYYQSEPIVDNDPKGFAPFLMASVEISRFVDQKQIK